jgi:hypothetical protein
VLSQSKISDESVDPISGYPSAGFMNGGNEVVCSLLLLVDLLWRAWLVLSFQKMTMIRE